MRPPTFFAKEYRLSTWVAARSCRSRPAELRAAVHAKWIKRRHTQPFVYNRTVESLDVCVLSGTQQPYTAPKFNCALEGPIRLSDAGQTSLVNGHGWKTWE